MNQAKVDVNMATTVRLPSFSSDISRDPIPIVNQGLLDVAVTDQAGRMVGNISPGEAATFEVRWVKKV